MSTSSRPRAPVLYCPQHRWEAGGERKATTPLLTRDSNSFGAYTLGWFGVGKDLVGNDSWAIADWAEVRFCVVSRFAQFILNMQLSLFDFTLSISSISEKIPYIY